MKELWHLWPLRCACVYYTAKAPLLGPYRPLPSDPAAKPVQRARPRLQRDLLHDRVVAQRKRLQHHLGDLLRTRTAAYWQAQVAGSIIDSISCMLSAMTCDLQAHGHEGLVFMGMTAFPPCRRSQIPDLLGHSP